MKALAALVVACLVAGCVSSGSQVAHRYYVLEARGHEGPTSAERIDATLLVAPTTASSFYANTEIAYSRGEGVRSYYQFSSWTESPELAINTQLISRLEQGSHFRMVVPAAAGIPGDLLLTTTLDEMYHDAAAPPGVSRLRLSAQLSNPGMRSLIARRTFDVSLPAPSFDAAGAVQGLRDALGEVLGQVTAWVNEYPTSAAASPNTRPGK
ncbi:MAG TPA: ABC-type transport auxiliary lipoprotein family protein [Caldimonas sp.]|jgi:ABC-type uncharacterized transport system auxiliary subunit